MDPATWTAVDELLTGTLVRQDDALAQALAASAHAGLPHIEVTPPAGKLLHVLARAMGARRILEIGTLGGYSTIWLARALPADGALVSLEISEKHAQVARANIERAGLAGVATVRTGPALESLAAMHREGCAPFDLVFIDADKPSNIAYLEWALRLARPGTLILCDNVIRKGQILDGGSPDPSVQGSLALLRAMGEDPRLCATAVQTVGAKGHDGIAMALVLRTS
ncbi:MAG: O-methyltransferase [Phycisphaerales bacterium]